MLIYMPHLPSVFSRSTMCLVQLIYTPWNLVHRVADLRLWQSLPSMPCKSNSLISCMRAFIRIMASSPKSALP